MTQRIGGIRAAGSAGIGLVAGSALAAAGADSVVVLTLAMVLLGMAWNLALISGTALLTSGVPADQRPRREGRGEIGMGVAAAAAAASLLLPIVVRWRTP